MNITPDVDVDDVAYSDEFGILFRKDRLSEFYPSNDLPHRRRLNSLARLLIYFGLLYFLWTRDTLVLLLLALILFILPKAFNSSAGIGSYINIVGGARSCRKEGERGTERKKIKCRSPTFHNPFMNPSVNDYLSDVDRPPACMSTDDETRDKIDGVLLERLYSDVDRLWGRVDNARQFVTAPNTTIPNDQGGFAKWLYDNPNGRGRENFICRNDLSITGGQLSP